MPSCVKHDLVARSTDEDLAMTTEKFLVELETLLDSNCLESYIGGAARCVISPAPFLSS